MSWVATFARVISYEHAPHLSLIDAKGIELLDQLEETIDTLGRSLSRLIVRVGPQSRLAEICRDVIAVAQDIKFELMGIGNSVDLEPRALAAALRMEGAGLEPDPMVVGRIGDVTDTQITGR